VRIDARAGIAGMLATVGLLPLGELAAQLLLGDPVTPQRLATLAVAVLAAVAAGCVAAAVRVERTPAPVPVVRRVTALRDKSWSTAFRPSAGPRSAARTGYQPSPRMPARHAAQDSPPRIQPKHSPTARRWPC
jgi:hypothetical protein